jgi:hypothetical protein
MGAPLAIRHLSGALFVTFSSANGGVHPAASEAKPSRGTHRKSSRAAVHFVEYIEVCILSKLVCLPHGPAASFRRKFEASAKREGHVAGLSRVRSGNQPELSESVGEGRVLRELENCWQTRDGPWNFHGGVDFNTVPSSAIVEIDSAAGFRNQTGPRGAGLQ